MDPRWIQTITLLTAMGLLLAGCMAQETEDDDGQDDDPTEQSYTLTLTDPPTNATAGQNFTISLTVAGAPQAQTDHLGAHFGPNSTTEPSTTVYPKTCAHQETTVPGTFEVTCKVDEAGMVYLRGHLRITTDDGTLNWWSDEIAISVAAA